MSPSYLRDPHLLLLGHISAINIKFHTRKAYRLEVSIKLCFVMITIIKLTQE